MSNFEITYFGNNSAHFKLYYMGVWAQLASRNFGPVFQIFKFNPLSTTDQKSLFYVMEKSKTIGFNLPRLAC